MSLQIKFRKIDKNVEIPKRNGAYYDLFLPKDVWIEPEKHTLIRLGFACELPKGYHACIVPRSSMFKVHKLLLANSIGIIDNAYCGNNDEWMLSVYMPKNPDGPIKIAAGTRLAQFEVVEDCEDLIFEVVETLENDDRGGFGSTGS